MSRLGRPLLRYHGGKWRIAPWIIAHFPAHQVYVEPYGGAGSVLLRKSRSYAEVLGDLNGDVVNLFRVLREPQLRRELIEAVRWTPYSRAEFEAAWAEQNRPIIDPVERARQMLLCSYAAYSSAQQGNWRTGFRGNVTRVGNTPADNWRSLPPWLEAIGERLRGVIIECRAALDVMTDYDTATTLHYLDPPYLPQTRHERHAGCSYRYEMTEADHRALIECARNLQGQVLISGYESQLYGELLEDWAVVRKATHGDGASARVECVWIKPGAALQARLF